MGLEVSVPDPPRLTTADDADGDDEYRRVEIETHLDSGAWEEAFESWAATTDMEEDAFEIAHELGLFDRFDFFWDQFAQRVGYSAPGIPEDWQQAQYHEHLRSWRQVSSINAGLAELGQVVCDILKDEYLDWEDDDWGEDLDLPDFE